MALAHITFRVRPKGGGPPVDLAQTTVGVIPAEGQIVALDSALHGRRRYRVVEVTHQYTDTGVRQVDVYTPAPVLVDLERVP